MITLNPHINVSEETDLNSSTPDGDIPFKNEKKNFIVRVFFDHEHGKDAHDLVQQFVTDRIAIITG